MADTFDSRLKLRLQESGGNSGQWGTLLNQTVTNIASVFGYGTHQLSNNADATLTLSDDGASIDALKASYLKITSAVSLTATRTLTFAPNTLNQVKYIENATTGSQSITISQGSGANVTIESGATKVVYFDGAGSGAAVVDALANIDQGTAEFNTIKVATIQANDGTASSTIANSTGVMTIASSVLTTTDINGGTIDGTTIGASTAAAGTFTTFTSNGIDDNASSTTVTIDSNNRMAIGGTVVTDVNLLNIQGSGSSSNIGVVLNDTSTSKIYSIQNGGSALKFFDYSTSTEIMRLSGGNVGLGGQTNPQAKLDIKGDTSSFAGMSKIYLTDTSSDAARRNWAIGNGGSAYGNFTIGVSNAADGDPMAVGTHTTPFIITSGGKVGIGGSPAATLHVKAGYPEFILEDSDTTNDRFKIIHNGGSSQILVDPNNVSSNSHLQIAIDGDEKFRIRSDGNAGLGSAGMEAFSAYRQLSIGAMSNLMGTASAGTDGSFHISQNAFLDTGGDWKAIHTDEASNYYQYQGGHYFRVASSTSANANISWVNAFEMGPSGGIVVNSSQNNNINFVVKSGATANALVVDGQSGNVGIGVSGASRGPLHVHQPTSNTDSNIHLTSAVTGSNSGDGFTISVSPGGAGDTSVALIQRQNAAMNFYTHAQLRMSLDNSGNLGIGVTPSAKLDVGGNIIMNGAAGTSPIFEMINNDNEDTDTGRESSLRFSGHRSGGEDVINAQISAHHDGSADDDKGMLFFYTNNGGGLNLAQKIDSSGNTHFGKSAFSVSTDGATITGNGEGTFTSTQSAANQESVLYLNRKSTNGDILKLYKDSSHAGSIGTPDGFTLYISASAAGGGRFDYINGTNARFIPCTTTGGSSTGNHDLGSTGSKWRDLYLQGSVYLSGRTSFIGSAGIAGYAQPGVTLIETQNTTTGTTHYAAIFRKNDGNSAGSIQISNTATAYVTSSDYRLKENVRTLEDGLERVKKLKPVKFNWVDDETETEGFIAHEIVEAGWSEGVMGKKDAVDENGNIQPQQVDYGRITPLLVKAIQEQQTLIESLTDRIAALEQ